MKLPIHALLICALSACALLLPATGALAWSPEWSVCQDVKDGKDKDQVKRAITACTRILAMESERPNYAMALRNRCAIRYEADDLDGALEDCNRAIEMDDSSSIAFERRGHVWAAKDQNARAMSDYDEAIRLDPQNAYAINSRGLLKRRIGDSAGGEADIARAEKIKPGINDR